jgi:hypothetical protein
VVGQQSARTGPEQNSNGPLGGLFLYFSAIML